MVPAMVELKLMTAPAFPMELVPPPVTRMLPVVRASWVPPVAVKVMSVPGPVSLRAFTVRRFRPEMA